MLDTRQAITDPLYFMENCLWIRTKQETLIPFKLNRPQRKVHALVTSLRASNRPVRIICLKARQEGISTYFGGLLFHRTATRRYVNTVIMAHKDDPSVGLFKMHTLFYQKLPNDVRPMKKYSNKRELNFENPRPDPLLEGADLGLQSTLSVFTAGSEDLSRSRTIHCLHWSEVAFTKGADGVHDATLSAVPKHPAPSIVLYESTANGPSGLFYELFWAAWENRNDWTAVFLPWWAHDEYVFPVGPGFVLDEHENQIRETYDLSFEQMAWRRYVLLNDFRGDESKFMQEYPANPKEAFQSSISAVFDITALNEMEDDIREPLCYAETRQDGLLQYPSVPPKDEEGIVREYVAVWAWPAMGIKYVLSIDAAGGGAAGDYLVAQVLAVDGEDIEQVARLADKMNPAQFAVKCMWLALAYNSALVSPERNSHGAAVVGMLLDKGYYKMYRDETGEYGIHVGNINKYELVGAVARTIWQRRLKIHDAVTMTALRSYQEHNGRFSGKNDDFVDAIRAGLPTVSRAYVSPSYSKARPVRSSDWDMAGWTNEMVDQFIDKNTRRAMY
jgi:hypothetical protein